MNIKKLLALLLALSMVMTMFAACGEGEKPDDDSKGGNVVSSDNDEHPNMGLTVNGEEIDVSKLAMMNISGIDIPFDEYRYMYRLLDSSYFSGGDETFWASNADAFPTLLEYVEYYVLENNWGNLLAQKYGVELNAEDEAQIEEYLQEEKDAFESEEDYNNALLESGITEDLLRRMIAQQVMGNRVYEELYNKDGALLAPSDDEIKTALKNDYVRVHHVLVANDHFADVAGYENATEEQLKAAALEYAEELREQILNGADIYELAQTVGDDPGMIGNTDGYFFSYGEMVEPFETASFALEVGGISDIVHYDGYGYFIIQRLEQDEYIEKNWDNLRGEYINDIFNSDVNEMLQNAEIVYSEYYDQLTYDSIH